MQIGINVFVEDVGSELVHHYQKNSIIIYLIIIIVLNKNQKEDYLMNYNPKYLSIYIHYYYYKQITKNLQSLMKLRQIVETSLTTLGGADDTYQYRIALTNAINEYKKLKTEVFIYIIYLLIDSRSCYGITILWFFTKESSK